MPLRLAHAHVTTRRRTIVEHKIAGRPLGRHVHHDSRSRRFPFPTAGIEITSVRHTRHVLPWDQGSLGSCVGNAGLGALATTPFWETLPGMVFTEESAVELYSQATRLDDYAGAYPPVDSGSDGLSVAKALKTRGAISGYQHTFSLQDALKALSVTPVITGINWYSSMDEPSPSGLIGIGADALIRGGHEVELDEVDAERSMVWFTNSWSTSWGIDGRAAMTWSTFGRLLDEDGDVTVFTPITEPAPTPTPVPGADDILAIDAKRWLSGWGAWLFPLHAAALRQWLDDTGH